MPKNGHSTPITNLMFCEKFFSVKKGTPSLSVSGKMWSGKPHNFLNDRSIQSFVFNNYMRYGSKMYYGAETLSYMYIIFWSSELTK